jgi:hypothetical protein
MSSDTSSKAPINPTDEVDKEKSSGKPEDKKKNSQHEEEEELETTNDEMSFQEWKAWKKKKKLQRKKGKFNTKIVIESSDDSDTDYKKRSSSSSNVKKRANYHRVDHDYTFQIPSEHNDSIHMGKPPHFDGTGYNQWKIKKFGYLSAIHKDLWKIVEVGCDIPDDDETPTPLQAYILQCNYQALNILQSSVSAEEFDKIEDALTAKDAWDTLPVNHQGSRKLCDSRIKILEDELSLFSMKKDETVKEMYNRMKKITNQIKSLGGDKWGDREIVDKLLTVYMARDVTLPSLIRAEGGFKQFTAENVLGRIEAHHDQLKRVKVNQDLADLQEQAAKNNGLALQAKSKGKEKATQSSKDDDSSDNEDDELDDEQMAFFIKNFRRVLRKSNFQNLGKNKYESRRRSSKACFGCKKIGHFIADCPEEKKKNKDTKKSSSKRDKPRYKTRAGEAHLGKE